jgi:hypothetical protein
MSACFTQPRNVSLLTPTRDPIRNTAAFNDKPGSCSRASTTSRTARSRSSAGYFLAAGIRPPSCGIRASSKPGALQSRLIVKLRGHGLIAKVPRARLYRITPYGQRVMTAAVAIHDDRYPLNYLAPAA